MDVDPDNFRKKYMMRFKKLSVFLLFGLILTACQQGHKADSTEIRLKLLLTATSGEQTVWLEELGIKASKKIDSVTFTGSSDKTFTIPAKEAGFYILRSSKGATLTLLLTPGEDAEVRAHTDSLSKQYTVKGSPGSAIIQQYALENSKNMQVYDSLRMVFKEASAKGTFPQIKDQLDTAFRKLVTSQQGFLIKLIQENPGNLSSVYLLNQYLGPQLLFDEEKNTALFVLVDSALMVKYPANEHARAHHARVTAFVEAEKRNQQAEALLLPGKDAPDFNLMSLDDKKIKLSDFRGKPVLLYFWQSMHAVSRKENIELVRVVKASSPSLPKLVCISLDADREMTRAAVRIDGLPGLQLYDASGMNGELASKYNLQRNFPRYILVGSDGTIQKTAATIADMVNQSKQTSKL
jgi:hypothetical protein